MAFHPPQPSRRPAANLVPANQQLLHYWHVVRGKDDAASRSRIDLARVSEILPQLAILERGAQRQSYRCRLAGTGITQLWGTDMTGRDLREAAGSFEAEVLARLFDGVFTKRQAFCARLKLRATGADDREAEMLGLPVIARDGSPQAMVSVVPLTVCWGLPVRPLRAIQIQAARLLEADGEWTKTIGSSSHRLKIITGGIDL